MQARNIGWQSQIYYSVASVEVQRMSVETPEEYMLKATILMQMKQMVL